MWFVLECEVDSKEFVRFHAVFIAILGTTILCGRISSEEIRDPN